MSEDTDRRTIISRAERMLKQSQLLRKMSDELLKESKDIRRAAKPKSKSGRKRR